MPNEAWRSIRAGGKSKTKKSRRTLALPKQSVKALRLHHQLQAEQARQLTRPGQERGLVFASTVGTEWNANNVPQSFRAVTAQTDLNPDECDRPFCANKHPD